MKKYMNGNEIALSSEEIAAMHQREVLHRLMEQSRPLTAEEVTAMLLTQQVNTLVVDDNTALRMATFYPEWAESTEYTAEAGRQVGYKVQWNGKLWRLRQEHTSQTGWEPENVPSLWEQINETHAGTLEDPIPYSGNLALEDGKYYHQDYVIYRCFRDTGNPVYQALAELVDLYVEIV